MIAFDSQNNAEFSKDRCGLFGADADLGVGSRGRACVIAAGLEARAIQPGDYTILSALDVDVLRTREELTYLQDIFDKFSAPSDKAGVCPVCIEDAGFVDLKVLPCCDKQACLQCLLRSTANVRVVSRSLLDVFSSAFGKKSKKPHIESTTPTHKNKKEEEG